MYWLSRRTRNDQFLLYCFAESGWQDAALRDAIARRRTGIPELRVRLRADPTGLAYPVWVPCEPDPEQIVTHELDRPQWPDLLVALGELLGTGVDAERCPWRLHIFRGIRDSPAPDQRVTVAVLQISHALVDGRGRPELPGPCSPNPRPTNPPGAMTRRPRSPQGCRRRAARYPGH